MNRKAILTIGSAMVLLAGCAADETAGAKYAARSKTTDHMTATLDPVKDAAASSIQKTHRNYLGENYTDYTHGDPLPERVEGSSGFVLTTGERLSLPAIAAKIRKSTGLTVLVEPTPKSEVSDQRSNAGVKGDDTIQTINDLIRTGMDHPLTGEAGEARAVAAYSGPLSQFLETELPKYGTDWDVQDQVIYLGKDIIRSYPIVDMPSHTTLSAGLSGTSSSASTSSNGTSSAMAGSPGGGNAGGGGTAASNPTTGGQSTTTTTSLNSWTELLSTLAAYTGSEKLVFAEPSDGKVTVKCPRYCQGQIARSIRDHNKTAGRSVLITVAILTVSKTGSDDYGFSPSVLYNNLPSGYTLSVLGQASALTTSQGGMITGGVLNPPTGSTAAKFNGTTLAVQAISSDAEITGGFQKYGFVGNNRPFSIRNALDYTYVQSIVTSNSTTLSNSALQMTTQVIGDELQVLPRVQNDGYIRLQLAISRTAIQSTDTVTVDGTETTIPQVTDNSSSPQEFTIRDGATLILSDIGDDSSNRSKSGAGSVFNWLFGGQASASNSKDKTIIIVTAREWHPGDEGPEILRGALQ